MKKIGHGFLAALLVMLLLGTVAHAGMVSDHYRIPGCVLSGGGGAMGSASFQTNATLGQSSPLSAEGAESASHALYPGFWYVLEAAGAPGGGSLPWLILLLGEM